MEVVYENFQIQLALGLSVWYSIQWLGVRFGTFISR